MQTHAGSDGLSIDVRCQALRRLSLFNHVDKDQVAQLAGLTEEILLAKGDRLFEKGQMASGFFIMVSGQVKLALPVNRNNERIVDILGPGKSFGEAMMFLSSPYPVFAEAISAATLIRVPQQPILDLLATDTAFARRMLGGMSIRLHHLILDIDAQSKLTSTQRLISFILQHLPLAERQIDRDEAISFRLPEKKNLIAQRLGLTPETLSRSLHELADKGFIDVQARLILIKDLAGLRGYGD